MSRSEWLRTFVAVYRTGSVTAGAQLRGLTQPAASQHLAALSTFAGGALVARSTGGVTPTERGRQLYADVAEPLDRLESVLSELDMGHVRPAASVRIGASADVFEARLLPLLTEAEYDVVATFGEDPVLLEQLMVGEVDVAVTMSSPSRRAMVESRTLGERSFALVAAPPLAPTHPLSDTSELAEWLGGCRWVSYSHELPVTRRFWTLVLGRPFDADVRLVAPDLRAVAAAVELGMGVSLLPTYICADAIAAGKVVKLYDVTELVPTEAWFVSTRRADAANPAIASVLNALVGAPRVS